MKVQILVDNTSSWIMPYAVNIIKALQERGHNSSLHHEVETLTSGDVLVLLSCEKIFKNLSLNKYNLVVHESDLPQGRGWSPMTWQVLEGKKEIPVTLFEANEKFDAGLIYAQKQFSVSKTDLIEDLRRKQALTTQELILEFVSNHSPVGKSQNGTPTYYRKRKPEDGEVSAQQSISDIWTLLQVSDNQLYPAFVIIEGQKFFIRVSKI